MENELHEALNECGKMHDYTTRRNRALNTFERRHRSE